MMHEAEIKTIVEVLRELIESLPYTKDRLQWLEKLDSTKSDCGPAKPTKCEHKSYRTQSIAIAGIGCSVAAYACLACGLSGRRSINAPYNIEWWPEPVDQNAKAIALIERFYDIERTKFGDTFLAIEMRSTLAKLRAEGAGAK